MTDYKLESIVDELAEFIRQVDGNNRMGAGALAEKICERFHVDTPDVQGEPVAVVVALNDRSQRGEQLIRLSDYEALRAECEALRTSLAETAGVAVTMLYDSHRQDTLKEFDVTELSRMVDCTKHLAGANVQVEKVYRKAWDMTQRCAGADWGGDQ